MTLITPIIITQLFIKFNQSNFNLKVDSQTEAITGQWTVKVSVVKIMTNRTGQKEQNPTEQNLNTASELGQKSKEAIEDTANQNLVQLNYTWSEYTTNAQNDWTSLLWNGLTPSKCAWFFTPTLRRSLQKLVSLSTKQPHNNQEHLELVELEEELYKCSITLHHIPWIYQRTKPADSTNY